METVKARKQGNGTIILVPSDAVLITHQWRVSGVILKMSTTMIILL